MKDRILRLVFSADAAALARRVEKGVREETEAGRHSFVITPESAVLKTEERLYPSLPDSAGLLLEVLTFRRLPDRVQRQFGGVGRGNLSEQGKLIAVASALKECAGELSVYGRAAESDLFVSSLAQCISRFKALTFTPEDVAAAAQNAKAAGVTGLAMKLADLAAVFAAYDAKLCGGKCDADDLLRKTAERLGKTPFFEDMCVFIDGFSGFTRAEYAIISAAIAGAREVVVTLPCPSHGTEDELYKKPNATKGELIRAAKSAGAKVVFEDLEKTCEKEAESLRRVGELLWSAEALPYDGGIEVFACGGELGEAEAAAMLTLALAKGGTAFGDILLCAADPSAYAGAVAPVFEKHGIPLYSSTKTELADSTLYRLVAALLGAVTGDFSASDLSAIVKSPLACPDADDADALELYIRTWSAGGKAVIFSENGLTLNPDGFGESVSERGRLITERAERARKTVAGPLATLCGEFETCENAKEFATALYRCLDGDFKAPEKLSTLADEMESAGDPKLADVTRQLWARFCACLDDCVDICGENAISAREFSHLLLLGLRSSKLSAIPGYVDEVQFVSADRLSGYFPKALIVLGATDGVFPRKPAEDGFFTEKELAGFSDVGLDLGADADRYECEPMREFTCAASLPTEKLFILFDKTKKLSFGAARLLALSGRDEPSDADALTLFGKEAIADAYAATRDERLAKILEKEAPELMRDAEKSLFLTDEKLSRETAAMKFGGDFELSPSAVELFAKCRLSCWSGKILRLRREKEARLEKTDVGTYSHAVLERFIKEVIFSGRSFSSVTEEDIDECVERYTADYARETFGGLEEKSVRFLHTVRRLKKCIAVFMKNMVEELAQSKFAPWRAECAIGASGEFDGLSTELPSGAKLSVRGFADRVDLYKKDGFSYVRVADYKQSGKKYNQSDVEKGLNLQMLMYLFSLCENARDGENGLRPAGVLYYPVVPRSDSKIKTFTDRFLPNGIVLNDNDVLDAMDASGRKRFIDSKKNDLLTAEEFENLRNTVKNVLAKIGGELAEGIADAHPLRENNYGVCSYCDYASLCRVEDPSEQDTV